MRSILNHWTCWKSTPEAVGELNRLLRGWSRYFHFLNSSRVTGNLRWWGQRRLMRWLWRKHGCRRALWSAHPPVVLYGRHGLWPIPLTAGWTGKTRS